MIIIIIIFFFWGGGDGGGGESWQGLHKGLIMLAVYRQRASQNYD